MLRVNYQITIGSNIYQEKRHLLDLRSQSSLSMPVNTCHIILGHPENLSINPQDSVSIQLGYGDNSQLIFTGIVGTVEWAIDRVIVYGISTFQALVTANFNLFYEKSSAGDIVRDIAQSRLKLTVENIEQGLTFPRYALGDRIPAYDHLRRLAEDCGFDFYANSHDKVVFAQYKAATTHELNYGSNLLSFQTNHPSPQVSGVEIYGESPSSQGQGEQSISWLTKKEIKGAAGSSSGVMLRLDKPTARNPDMADKIAQSLLNSKQQKQRGQIKILGDATLQLGDEVNVANLPRKEQNGTFKVTGVRHRFNRRQGFYTNIDWEKS